MGFSCGDDIEKKEKEVATVADEIARQRNGMEVQMQHHGFELEVEFWPVEHPLEPQDDDRPVKCPMPSASSVITDSKRKSTQEESVRKIAELPGEGTEVAMEPPVRAMRKRHHHTLTHDEHQQHTLRMPSDLSPSAQQTQKNITIFQMLQDFDKFD